MTLSYKGATVNISSKQCVAATYCKHTCCNLHKKIYIYPPAYSCFLFLEFFNVSHSLLLLVSLEKLCCLKCKQEVLLIEEVYISNISLPLYISFMQVAGFHTNCLKTLSCNVVSFSE